MTLQGHRSKCSSLWAPVLVSQIQRTFLGRLPLHQPKSCREQVKGGKPGELRTWKCPLFHVTINSRIPAPALNPYGTHVVCGEAYLHDSPEGVQMLGSSALDTPYVDSAEVHQGGPCPGLSCSVWYLPIWTPTNSHIPVRCAGNQPRTQQFPRGHQ